MRPPTKIELFILGVIAIPLIGFVLYMAAEILIPGLFIPTGEE
ncbi:hypothetical protein [Pseudomonas chlororaphis]|nr:hypothetical protein [Pseudomonas chlororaphis]AZC39480.1 hypothetical protein C4K37_5115 [Pseudomonas chlororaphis subsp. piscium]AZC46031.1 hypothetical protein C4K36_5128 [Pseudomonas chlororaphis subsp. piscium]AZC52772.1 hypothetical protein C4K35_5211 [Pseudomonas chlororaphis subsp. piscium]AZC91357.1 hypothetical protein C4K29_5078 [Pseudomonas chlororaphis subsp. piscium]WDG71564.1 hypothetical protein PUP65_26230 [Pseudomonas chlororaphis]